MTHHRQMRSAGRDQTETRATITSFEAFLTRYPNSKLQPEAETRLREARDRFGEHEFGVGRYYYTIKWYPAAIDRWRALLKQDPDYSGRDAVYFFLGESLIKMGNGAGSPALLREAGRRVRAERAPAGSSRPDRAAEDHGCRQHRKIDALIYPAFRRSRATEISVTRRLSKRL